jgi:hypothetical protein
MAKHRFRRMLDVEARWQLFMARHWANLLCKNLAPTWQKYCLSVQAEIMKAQAKLNQSQR